MKQLTLLLLVFLLTLLGCNNPADPTGNGEDGDGDGATSPLRGWSAVYAFEGISDFTLEDSFATSDGGEVFVGWSTDSGSDALVMKVDEDGAPLWARRLDSAGFELATSGVEAPDGDLIVAGVAAEVTNQFGLLMLRFAADGALESSYAVDMTDSADVPVAVFVDDGDLLITGNLMDSTLTQAEDAFAYRVGAIPANISEADSGIFETFDVDNNSATHVYDAVLHESEVLLAVASDTNSGGSTTDAALVSLSPNINDGSPPRLAAVMGSNTSYPLGDDRFTDLGVLSNGDVLAVGTTDSFSPAVRDDDMWAARLTYDESDSTTPWDAVWQKIYVGAEDDRARALVETNEGYAIAGTTGSYGAGGTDAWIVEIHTDGSVLDQYALGGSSDEGLIGVEPAVGGGFTFAGTTASFSPPSLPAQAWAVRGTPALALPDSLRSDTDATVSSTFTAVETMLTQFGDESRKTTLVEIDLSTLTSTPISVEFEKQ